MGAKDRSPVRARLNNINSVRAIYGFGQSASHFQFDVVTHMQISVARSEKKIKDSDTVDFELKHD